jgi:NTE family protein
LLTDAQALKLIDVSEIRLHHHVRRRVARDFRRLARMMTGRAIGLVLSGGGVRGLSHIGVLRALREAGIEIDLFGGVSMGAIIAACAALEWNDDDIYRRLRATFIEKNPLNDYTLPLVALTRGRRLSRTLREHFGDRRIEDCPYTYFCVSSNLGTGRIKVHRNGPVWWANRASVAVPGVLPPVIDGTDVLVDGGVMNNLPVDIMNEMRCGPVIAADVSQESNFHASIDDVEQPPLWRILRHARRGTPNIVTILMAAGSHGSDAILRAMRAQVDLLIQTPLHQFGWLDWKEFDTAVEAGYQSAKRVLEEKGEQLFGSRDRAILPGRV